MNIQDCEDEIAKLPKDTCQKVQTDVSDFESVTAALAKTKSDSEQWMFSSTARALPDQHIHLLIILSTNGATCRP